MAKWIRAELGLVLGLLSIGLLGCGGPAAEEAGVVRIGNGGEPRDLDPHTITGTPEARIIFSLMEGLVTYHPTDDSIPYAGAAERWEVSEDGRTWRFFLREDGRWSNGDPVTAGDFVYAWRRVLIPELGNEYADWLYMIRGAEAFHKGELADVEQVGIRAEGERVFVVELHEPVADFLQILLNHTFLPVHPATIEAHGGPGRRSSGWTRPENYVGNGAFRLVEWLPNSRIRLEPNPYYWDAEVVKAAALEFYPINDENTELRAFESGQLHVTNSAPVNMRSVYRERFPDRIRFDPMAGVYFFRFNITRPPLDDVRVRQALSLAIDREQIIQRLLQGGERVGTSLVPDGIGQFATSGRQMHDPVRARQLLAEAGFAGGAGFPELELLFNTSDNHRKIAEAVQSMWRSQLGIDISLTNKEWMVYLNTTQQMQYDISRAGWVGSLYPLAFLRILMIDSSNNETGFGDPDFDALLRQASRTLDPDLRHVLLREAEERLFSAMPITPLYWYTNIYLIDPRVRGWAPKLSDQRPMKFVYLED